MDGLEAWGESRLQVLHSDDEDEDEEQEDDDPEMEVDDDQEQRVEDRDRLAVVSFRYSIAPSLLLKLGLLVLIRNVFVASQITSPPAYKSLPILPSTGFRTSPVS